MRDTGVAWSPHTESGPDHRMKVAAVRESAVSLSDEDKEWISERLEHIETNVLTEFHTWASPVEARQRSHTAASAPSTWRWNPSPTASRS